MNVDVYSLQITRNAKILITFGKVTLRIYNLKPNSLMYNFVEVSGHNLDSSQT
jgi:hypothetical protein